VAPLVSSTARAEVTRRVRDFYERLPFGFHATAAAAAQSVRATRLERSLPDLHRLLASGEVTSVLEIGCGAGWLSNAVAHRYGIPVTGIDLSAKAVRRARGVARSLGTSGRARFAVADLFELDAGADLVVSLGALHHTHSTREALQAAGRAVGPGGHLYVGLYHRPGREVFLGRFRRIVERDGEEAALREYAAIDPARRGDDTHLRSWFRDQVLHPHESLHTLREVARWLRADGFDVLSTSVNGFAAFSRVEDVVAHEGAHAEIARRALDVERRFVPGFFTVLARRVGSGRPRRRGKP